MESKLQNNIGFFFAAVLVTTLIGFYPTYFMHFPTFEGFNWVHHFHGFIATLWICMLIAQAFLIRVKNYTLHRRIGKASYFVMPLLLLSFFLMAREMYIKNININHLSEADARAALIGSGIPDILYMGILYSLGIIYKQKTPWHLRFFACTGLMILGPGLGRFAFVNFPTPVAIAIMVTTALLIPIAWLIADIVKKKSPIPLLVFIAITISVIVKGNLGHSAWWQGFTKWIVNTLF